MATVSDKAVFNFGLEEENPGSVVLRLAKRKLCDVGHIHESFRCLRVRTGEYSEAAAQWLSRAYGTGCQQQFFITPVNMRIPLVARTSLLDHDAADAVEEMCPGFGLRACILCHLAKHSQSERIFVQCLDSASRQMRQQFGGIDRKKLLGKEGTSIIVCEQPLMKRHWRLAIVILDLHSVGTAAGKDEGWTIGRALGPDDESGKVWFQKWHHILRLDSRGTGRVVNAFRYLLDNARKHGQPPTGLRIQDQIDRVNLTVSDNGSGFPTAEHEKVSEPTFRGAGKLTLQEPGLECRWWHGYPKLMMPPSG